MGSFFIPKFKDVIVRREGTRVMLIQDGVLLLDLPWDQARRLARAIRVQAARAEARAKVQQTIGDQAVLIRKGFPLALTSDPEVFREAGKEAAHDRDLRRFLPGGIPSGVKFGIPRITGAPAEGGKTGGPDGHQES